MNHKKFLKVFCFLLSFITCLSMLSGCSALETANTQATAKEISNDISGLKIHYIDVGQADSILIQSPSNKYMLIDAGETKDNAILSYLNSLEITKLDYVFATHPHNDHISEMADVIKHYDIDNFYMPKISHTSKSFENMVNALSDKKIFPTAAKAGMSFELDEGLKCEILAPVNDSYENLNNYSIVLKLTYGKNSFLFTGDAEELSEKEILKTGADLSADVLKVGHHGSSTSTSKAFLNAVSPQYAVISCGKDNDYGHPHKETIEKLKNINTYITKDNGNIIISSDSEKINVYCDIVDNSNSTNVTKNTTSNDSSVNVSEKNITYIGNKNSKKYHTSSCTQLPNEENRIYFNSQEDAENQGYEAHKNCTKW